MFQLLSLWGNVFSVKFFGYVIKVVTFFVKKFFGANFFAHSPVWWCTCTAFFRGVRNTVTFLASPTMTGGKGRARAVAKIVINHDSATLSETERVWLFFELEKDFFFQPFLAALDFDWFTILRGRRFLRKNLKSLKFCFKICEQF